MYVHICIRYKIQRHLAFLMVKLKKMKQQQCLRKLSEFAAKSRNRDHSTLSISLLFLTILPLWFTWVFILVVCMEEYGFGFSCFWANTSKYIHSNVCVCVFHHFAMSLSFAGSFLFSFHPFIVMHYACTLDSYLFVCMNFHMYVCIFIVASASSAIAFSNLYCLQCLHTRTHKYSVCERKYVCMNEHT